MAFTETQPGPGPVFLVRVGLGVAKSGPGPFWEKKPPGFSNDQIKLSSNMFKN